MWRVCLAPGVFVSLVPLEKLPLTSYNAYFYKFAENLIVNY